jgi:hypothetical protein
MRRQDVEQLVMALAAQVVGEPRAAGNQSLSVGVLDQVVETFGLLRMLVPYLQ